MKVLVVEDDRDTAAYIARGLRENAHVVDVAENGQEGLTLALNGGFDVLVVDRMLPILDGLSLVRTLRSANCLTPVLFLTTLGGVTDRVDGLNAGGDDYLVKPFAFSELNARVEALARRPPLRLEETSLSVGTLKLDLLTRTVTRGGEKIDLQPRELKLLEVLMRNKGRMVTRTMLLEQVWEFHFDPKTSVVETLVSRLRTKIDKPFETDTLQTVRGLGYRLDDAG